MRIKIEKYSVLLLYPETIAETFGQETYLAHVEAKSPEDALKRARKKCLDENSLTEDQAAQFYPLLITTGFINDLTSR